MAWRPAIDYRNHSLLDNLASPANTPVFRHGIYWWVNHHFDPKAAKSTVEKMQLSIDKAIQGHDKLLETLGVEKPTAVTSKSK